MTELTWRRAPSSLWTYLLVIGLTAARSVIFARQLMAGRADLWDSIFGVLEFALLVAALSVLAVELFRTRVRLLDTGLEIRRLRTRIHPYAEIADAYVDRGGNDRRIRVKLRDGAQVVLPAPTRGLRNPSLGTLPDAVAAIRQRSGLEPARPLLP